MNIKNKYTKQIKAKANSLGFAACGISKAEFLEKEAPRLESYLNKNHNGKMKYMENYFDKRLNPTLLVEGAKSVISLLYNYYPSDIQLDVDDFKISKFAYGKDYHYVIKEKLKGLMSYISEEIGEINGRIFVDSAPVLERAWAQKSGLGWIGKNANLIMPQAGSFFFIAEIIIDLELEHDVEIKDRCGSCTKCIDACPTNAIFESYKIDGSKCISYFTIELKDSIPENMKGKFNNWIFGCDICQDVCPWNRFSIAHSEPAFNINTDVLKIKKADWQELTLEVFKDLFKGTAVERTKFNGLKRNIDFLG